MDPSSTLRDCLCASLGWDAVVADGVTAALSQASSRAEVDQIVKDYVGSNAEALAAINAFVKGRFPESRTARPPPPPPPQQLSDSDLKAALYMGTNVKTTVKRTPKSEKYSQSGEAPVLLRKVVNCLRCGKFFDCRRPGGESGRFLASGGLCTFCGAVVRLEWSDGSTNEGLGPEEAAAESSAEAAALRDRLVEFDRQSAKRTTVIDDQSDYFAIDSNAWLDDEERAELRRRAAEEEAATEAARSRLTVTIDLLGRRVIMDGAEDGVAGGSGGGAAVEAAMAATAAERGQGGGAAAAGPQAALQQEGSQGHQQRRISVCPSMASANYKFVGQGKRRQGGRRGGAAGAGAGAAGSSRPPRLQHDDPFEAAARDLAEIMDASK